MRATPWIVLFSTLLLSTPPPARAQGGPPSAAVDEGIASLERAVPFGRTFRIAIAPIARVDWESVSGVQLDPPLVVFQIPPSPVPIKTVLALRTASVVTRPDKGNAPPKSVPVLPAPMGAGAIPVQELSVTALGATSRAA